MYILGLDKIPRLKRGERSEGAGSAGPPIPPGLTNTILN